MQRAAEAATHCGASRAWIERRPTTNARVILKRLWWPVSRSMQAAAGRPQCVAAHIKALLTGRSLLRMTQQSTLRLSVPQRALRLDFLAVTAWA